MSLSDESTKLNTTKKKKINNYKMSFSLTLKTLTLKFPEGTQDREYSRSPSGQKHLQGHVVHSDKTFDQRTHIWTNRK